MSLTVQNTELLLPFLDRHLIYPILEFLQPLQKDDTSIKQAKFDLLQGTGMPGHCITLYKELGGSDSSVIERLEKKRNDVDAEQKSLEESANKILQVLENPDIASSLRQDKSQNLQFLSTQHGIQSSEFEKLFRLGQHAYNTGNYGGAADLLYHFRILSQDEALVTKAGWGKLASDCLLANWDDALNTLQSVRERIDAQSDLKQALTEKLWLMHWSLFPIFGGSESASDSPRSTELIELFCSPSYLNAIQTNAPHLLRYLAVAVLTLPNLNNFIKRNRTRELLKILDSQGMASYNDSILDFVRALYLDFDFERALALRKDVQDVVSVDFFLNSDENANKIKQALNVALTEQWLKLHRSAAWSLSAVSSALELTDDMTASIIEDELSHLATIDDGEVEYVQKESDSWSSGDKHAQIVEKTKSLIYRGEVVRDALGSRHQRMKV